MLDVDTKLFPNGIIIDYMSVEYGEDPTTEITDFDVSYGDDYVGRASANLIVEAQATTAGVWTEDTDANFNSGTAIPTGKHIFMTLVSDPTDANVFCKVKMIFHAEED